ncbi:SMC family ATPase [Streptomyces sp. B6B3]|uniref:SMC family ATPase n=1 Tax=Streptomyces sp. B6B3 TaxID=3153570 RepID=UPI00325E730B
MRLHHLTVTAFGPFATTHHIDFDQLASHGLYLLHGPTGAGKTSLLDAVCYALYGSVPGARQSSSVSLRSDHADSATRTEVVLDLTLGGRRLEITRRPEQERPKKRGAGTTRDKAATLLRERHPTTHGWQSLSNSHQETGEELTRLLGMNRDQFCQVVLLPQGDFARFLRAPAEDRAKLLGRLFDTRRFGAAETHLAEQRATAAERVRTADERLLATAHRIDQAAGPPAGRDTAGHPAPGDPHLAESILVHAAHARCTARERRDIAALALRTAETAHADTQTHHADTQELARLQTRHAEARARADLLDAQRPERDATRTRLTRARAADTVTPALALRHAAEAEHRAAAAAERHARAPLPAELAEAPAAHLADRERAAGQRLGALAAAHRAEQRARHLTAELARLDTEAVADEELQRAAARNLDRWPTTHEALRQRLHHAQQALTQAAQIAQHLDTAQRRLAAAGRRDDLARDIHTADRDLLAAREQAADAYAHWLDLKERRLHQQAAELALGLTPGHPCAVCGATEHPRPARPTADHVDPGTEDAALPAPQEAERRRADTEQRLAAARAAHTAATAEAGDDPRDDLAAAVHELRTAHGTAQARAADEPAARRALDDAERGHADLVARTQEAQRRAAARASRRDALDAERAALHADLDHTPDGTPGLAERVAALTRHTEELAAATAAARTAEETAQRLKQADDRLADAAYRAGFGTPQAAADATLPPDEQQRLQKRLDAWHAEETGLAATLADPRITAAAAQPPADPAAAQTGLDTATRRLRAASAADTAARARCADLDTLSAQAAAEAARLAPLRTHLTRVTRLAGLVAGTSPENDYRMRLETYVLAARLEQVAAVATTRLHRMSAGRYTLVHTDARAAGRARSGLGLHVVDAWTGRARDTATLSGGESFFVSLALALGLADVVAQEAGGQRLDTLFIDEGFGSLDEQSLDEVLDVLDALREHDRSVAIVSHVPDLRARIPAQLEVLKTRHGSTVRHHTAPRSP